MEEVSFTVAPPVFNGENYQTWAVRMIVHLQALDVWEAIEEDYEIPPLGANPTVAQMKNHKEKKTRKVKAKACLFPAISPLILTRIMQLESVAEIWEHLREEYQGNERVKNMQVMNLIREFEMVMMESQTIKDYAEQLLTIANKVRLLATCFANESTSESWLMDSGCTNHMTYNQDLFREIDRTSISKVRIGNGEYIPIKCKGTVAIESLTSLKLISDVLFVPDIDQNLLSVGQLVEKGFKVCFEDRNCIIKDAESREKNRIVEGLPDLEEELPICAVGQYRKQTRLPFPKKTARKSTQKLQLVHMDVGGPQKTPSLKRSKYYIAFIDDFTRFCWIYFLTYKSEVVDVFWRYKAMVENQSEYNIKVKRDKLDKKSEPGIFIGYSSTSKAYKIYLPQTSKIVSWDEQNQQYIDEDVDELPVTGFKTLFDIYQRCNIVVLEPAGFVKVVEHKKWRVAMREELNMIDKNNTWELVDRPSHKICRVCEQIQG
uniref:Uncharacterized protein n=1 Tax=Vitis vinifera TaxID=29760 RepID=A5B4I3_VITVI|nr:hypothetical protein VITISV_042416 [Vitis vinifera]